MKKMNDFVAQQLSKKQMNNINGGQKVTECIGMRHQVECTFIDANGNERRSYGCANDLISAIGNAQHEIESLNGEFNAHNCIAY